MLSKAFAILQTKRKQLVFDEMPITFSIPDSIRAFFLVVVVLKLAFLKSFLSRPKIVQYFFCNNNCDSSC